jgi:hypothetical protein
VDRDAAPRLGGTGGEELAEQQGQPLIRDHALFEWAPGVPIEDDPNEEHGAEDALDAAEPIVEDTVGPPNDDEYEYENDDESVPPELMEGYDSDSDDESSYGQPDGLDHLDEHDANEGAFLNEPIEGDRSETPADDMNAPGGAERSEAPHDERSEAPQDERSEAPQNERSEAPHGYNLRPNRGTFSSKRLAESMANPASTKATMTQYSCYKRRSNALTKCHKQRTNT